MKGPADSPTVSLTGEDFRSAETWEYADDGPGEGIMGRISWAPMS